MKDIYNENKKYNELKDKIDSLDIDLFKKLDLKWDLCDMAHEFFLYGMEALNDKV